MVVLYKNYLEGRDSEVGVRSSGSNSSENNGQRVDVIVVQLWYEEY